MIAILTLEAKITGGTAYDGLDRFAARKKILADLQRKIFWYRKNPTSCAFRAPAAPASSSSRCSPTSGS